MTTTTSRTLTKTTATMTTTMSTASSGSACILYPALAQRLAGPTGAEQLRENAARPPIVNAGMPLLQVTIRGGKVEATKFANPRDERADYVDWRNFTVIEDADMQRGTYAAVRCMGGDFFRMLDAPPA
eukprot:457539-Pyramimonas_sp.AAC.1